MGGLFGKPKAPKAPKPTPVTPTPVTPTQTQANGAAYGAQQFGNSGSVLGSSSIQRGTFLGG